LAMWEERMLSQRPLLHRWGLLGLAAALLAVMLAGPASAEGPDCAKGVFVPAGDGLVRCTSYEPVGDPDPVACAGFTAVGVRTDRHFANDLFFDAETFDLVRITVPGESGSITWTNSVTGETAIESFAVNWDFDFTSFTGTLAGVWSHFPANTADFRDVGLIQFVLDPFTLVGDILFSAGFHDMWNSTGGPTYEETICSSVS